MKRTLVAISLAVFLVAVPAACAQEEGTEHGQIGVFGSYFRSPQTHTNFAGLGGRFSLNAAQPLQFEGELSYDFSQVFTEGFTSPSSGSVTFVPSNIRVLHGLFGPKLQTRGPVRLFATLKGGFTNYRFDTRPAGFTTFTSSVQGLRTDNVNGLLYPGGGMEAHLGPLGLRFDIGDEIYFNNGAHHGLRLTFGPILRF
jgi:hypothetical protein